MNAGLNKFGASCLHRNVHFSLKKSGCMIIFVRHCIYFLIVWLDFKSSYFSIHTSIKSNVMCYFYFHSSLNSTLTSNHIHLFKYVFRKEALIHVYIQIKIVREFWAHLPTFFSNRWSVIFSINLGASTHNNTISLAGIFKQN